MTFGAMVGWLRCLRVATCGSAFSPRPAWGGDRVAAWRADRAARPQSACHRHRHHAAGIESVLLHFSARAAGHYGPAHHRCLSSRSTLPAYPIFHSSVQLCSPRRRSTYLGLLAVLSSGYVTVPHAGWLAVRMVGENPHAAEAQGINVTGVRMGAVIAGSALMGVGGSYLTFRRSIAFFPRWCRGAAGYAWRWCCSRSGNLARRCSARLLYGLFDAYQLRLQTLFGKAVPYEVFLMLPYLMSIVALAALSRRATAPQALLKPFRRGER